MPTSATERSPYARYSSGRLVPSSAEALIRSAGTALDVRLSRTAKLQQSANRTYAHALRCCAAAKWASGQLLD
jgi:hypothetical protein